MNCQQADNYIYEYCDARLSPELMQEFEEHLASCETCTNLVILTRFENDALHECMETTMEVDENFTARIMAALPAAAAPALSDIQIIKPSRSWRPVAYFAVVAATTVLMFTTVVPGLFDQMQDKNVAVHDSIQPELRENASLKTGKINEDGIALQSAGTDTAEKESDSTNRNVITDSGDSGNSAEVIQADVASMISENSTPSIQIAMADYAALKTPAPALQRGISSTGDQAMPKAASVPDRYRSYSVNLVKPIEEVSLVPDNLPGNYVLASDSEEIFVYNDTKTGKTVEIAIRPYAAPTANTMAKASIAANEILTTESAASAPLTQQLEVIAEYEESQYVVSLESNLDHDELLDLAGQIKLAPAQ